MENIISAPQLPIIKAENWFQPHRIILLLILAGLVITAVMVGDWEWVPRYLPRLISGVGVTIAMLFSSVILGYMLALPLGLVQVTGPWWLKIPAASFCTMFRGTPLLLQLWLVYYGLGSLFPMIPGIKTSFLWPYLREAWPYGVFALTISFAAYEGEVMRGAFAGVPSGELQAARAFGMGRWKVFRRIWFPRAFYRALPTLVGETVLHLKATPLVATITVIDAYGVIAKVRQETLLTYEPLLLLAVIYLLLTFILVLGLRYFENRIPVKGV